MNEPQIHSHITDGLPDAHPFAWRSVDCAICQALVHADNNECMQTWVESDWGIYCLTCFATMHGAHCLPPDVVPPRPALTGGVDA